MKTYSMDLRERVLKDVDTGLATSAVAAKYSVSTAWVRRLKQRRAASGLIAPKPQRRGSIPAAVTYAEQIREAVRQVPDATLDEYRTRLKWPMSRSTLANALITLGLTRKKVDPGERAESLRREGASRRVESLRGEARSEETRVPRRDLGQHQLPRLKHETHGNPARNPASCPKSLSDLPKSKLKILAFSQPYV